MIVHEVVSDQPDLIQRNVVCEQSQIEPAVMSRMKDRLSMVPALRDMMHPAGNHKCGGGVSSNIMFRHPSLYFRKRAILAWHHFFM